MKLLHSVFLLLLFWNAAVAQQRHTHILNISNASRTDSLAIETAIVNTHNAQAVDKAIAHLLKNRNNITGQVIVFKDNKTHIIHYFGQVINLPTKKKTQISYVSKGTDDGKIRNTQDFQELPDSLVLIDTLKLHIAFTNQSYPWDSYFFEKSNGTQRTSRALPLSNGKLLFLPQWFEADTSRYVSITLINHATPHDQLWTAQIKMLSQRQINQVFRFGTNLRQALPEINKEEFIKSLYDFIWCCYGKPFKIQVRELSSKLY